MNKIFSALAVLLISFNLYADYNRIISLAPSVTQSLYELGMEKEVIANTTYCPKGTLKKEIIGTLTEPNIEKIINLKPDLIISTKEGNNKAAVEKMKRLGLKVYVIGTSSSFSDICENFRNLADFLQKGTAAEKIISETTREIKAIYEETEKEKRERVFWEIGANPLVTVGKKSFVNDYNKYAGGKNIFQYIDMRYPNITLEKVIEKNPDVILVVSMGNIGNEEVRKWKKYVSINAVKNNKLYILDANDIFALTPMTFLNAVKVTKKVLSQGQHNE